MARPQFRDRNSQFPNRRKLIPVEGQPNTYDVERAEGTVLEQGTVINADTLNSYIDYLDSQRQSAIDAINAKFYSSIADMTTQFNSLVGNLPILSSTVPTALSTNVGSPGSSPQNSRADHRHALPYGTTANTVTQGNDSRLTFINNLSSASTTQALAANQGRILANAFHPYQVTPGIGGVHVRDMINSLTIGASVTLVVQANFLYRITNQQGNTDTTISRITFVRTEQSGDRQFYAAVQPQGGVAFNIQNMGSTARLSAVAAGETFFGFRHGS